MRVVVRHWGLAAVIGRLAAGCTLAEDVGAQGPSEPPPAVVEAPPAAAAGDAGAAAGDAGAAASPDELDPASLVGSPEATDLAAAPVRLPAGWDGTGVLAKRAERLPRRAPAWAKVSAQVDERDGRRYLVTSGAVAKIKDAHLARSTAANRAIAELGRWTKADAHAGSHVREVWRDPRTGRTFAQVELPVPGDWVPGTPLGSPRQ